MNTDQNKPGKKQPEDGNEHEPDVTNSNATLANQTPQQPDAPTLTNNATTAASDNLTQSVMNGSEINPEYGDAADPTFEKL